MVGSSRGYLREGGREDLDRVQARGVARPDGKESSPKGGARDSVFFALISTDELEGLGQIMVKQLKNRYNDLSVFKRFVVGIDRAKMRLYDCEQTAQEDILDSGQEEEYNYEEKKPKKSFDGFNF